MKREILIVDDQPGIRMLLTDILTNEGYHISIAKTGKEALEKVYASTYDLIILDYKLPIFTGLQVIQQLEKEHIELPAIIISGLVEEVKAASKKYEMIKRVIAKPFNVIDIQQTVNAILT